MRILMTADAVGGVWTYSLDLSAALAQHDIKVVLATMGPRPSDAQRAAVGRLSNVQLVESDYRLEWMTDPWRDVSAAGDWLLDLARGTAVDVVHLNGYSHAAVPWQLPVVCVAHSCVVSWWQAVHGTEPPAEWNTYKRNVARGLSAADRVIAPTHAFLTQLQSCYGLRRPAEVIRNGRPQSPPIGHAPASQQVAGATPPNDEYPVDPPKSEHAGDSPNRGRADAVGERREPILLGCGRLWDAAKNLRVFDAAAEGLPWPAYVIGDPTGPDGQIFAPKNLQTLGALPHQNVESWLRRASVFVHPALYEPFGLAVLEAAAGGCALVLSNIPTLRELWDGAAEFYNPCDSSALHAALNSLISDPARRAALAAAARKRAAEYNVESTAAAYANVYRSLAGGASRVSQPSGARAVA